MSRTTIVLGRSVYAENTASTLTPAEVIRAQLICAPTIADDGIVAGGRRSGVGALSSPAQWWMDLVAGG
ncbi:MULTISPECIES: hypothetical protein [Brevibacterium]|uniref:hypothetical protein n=1 Tax=Brevibacterium TaxID=1696 RepID=UPI00142F795F